MKIKSIKTRITIYFAGLILFVCLGLSAFAEFSSRDALKSSIDESLLEIAKADAEIISERINTQFNALEAWANDPSIKSSELSIEEKLALLQVEVERSGHEIMMLADRDGKVTDTNGNNSDIRDREYFKQALAGEKAISDPIVSKTNGSVVVVLAVPIKDGNKVTGVLIAGRNGNELSTYAKEMQFNDREVYMINREGTTVAHKDENLVLQMFNIVEQYAVNPDLKEMYEYQMKMAAGESGVGTYTFNGTTRYMAYYPVEGTNWSLAITAPKQIVMAKVTNLTMNLGVLSFIFLLAGILITLLIARNIAKPIKETTKYLNIIATGDFTSEISKKLLAKHDEIGILANSLEKMQASMRTMMKTVIDESTIVSQMLTTINQNMFSLNESIEEISSTTEELSAGTEETAASSEQMNATSTEVEKAIESMASKAQEGAATVSKVSTMSGEMKEKAISSKQEALEIYGKTKTNLQSTIEQSKAVEQINELSNSILEITTQTNLLALNAAIEAARAGESGKGFAVVADEIRKLAEGSKTSVSRIQEVAKQVLSVVNALCSSSMEVMEFIDKKVLQDYESLVQSSERYNELSVVINDIVMDFSSTSEELLASMQNMILAINQISTSANEEAAGASNIAQKTEAIVNMTEDVVKLANQSNKKSEDLIRIVRQFKI